MRTYQIEGGNRLEGTVDIGGSKNAALAIVAAAMVLDGPCRINNLPEISDISILLEICSGLGAQVEWIDKKSVRIDPTSINTSEAMQPLMHEIRASYYMMGALLGRFNKVKLRMPGGCDFGSRPIDLHLKGFSALGAETEVSHGNVECVAEKLEGGSIFLDTVSVGATVNIILAAVKAEGKTVIDNAAREPHIVDLANFLNTMGADIRGAGTDVIRVTGRPVLPGRKDYTIIPDQIEAGTYMMLAPLTGGDITVNGVIPKHMEPLTAKLKEMGVKVKEGEESIRITHNNGNKLKPTSFKTMPYPGYPTDLQPQTVTLLCVANGTGRMLENVWENRYQYIDSLRMMGANILTSGKLAVIQGGNKLTGARVKARDLRAGAAMVMAALAAEGQSIITNVEAIERGYEHFTEKLRKIGADIRIEEIDIS